MKKALLSFLGALLLSSASVAQTTAVTATVVDSDTTVWANSLWTLSFQPGPYDSNPAHYTIGGVPLTQSVAYQTGVGNGSGVISFTTYRSTSISPIGSSWNLQVCPNASASCGTINFSTSGASQNISSVINAAIKAPRFLAVSGAFGYIDGEAIQQLKPGSTYWNTSTSKQRCYDGSAWADCDGGSGPATGITPNGIQNQDWAMSDNSTQNWLTRQTVYPKDPPFNAAGDGVTDDTAALNAASLYAAATGGVLELGNLSWAVKGSLTLGNVDGLTVHAGVTAINCTGETTENCIDVQYNTSFQGFFYIKYASPNQSVITLFKNQATVQIDGVNFTNTTPPPVTGYIAFSSTGTSSTDIGYISDTNGLISIGDGSNSRATANLHNGEVVGVNLLTIAPATSVTLGPVIFDTDAVGSSSDWFINTKVNGVGIGTRLNLSGTWFDTSNWTGHLIKNDAPGTGEIPAQVNGFANFGAPFGYSVANIIGGTSLGLININEYVSAGGTQSVTYQNGIYTQGIYYSAAGIALPSCTSTLQTLTANVSDATVPTYNGTYTSGGAVKVPVYCNGSAWSTH